MKRDSKPTVTGLDQFGPVNTLQTAPAKTSRNGFAHAGHENEDCRDNAQLDHVLHCVGKS